jgi:acetylornithine deacetylase
MNEYIDLLTHLIAIPSVTGDEAAAADYLQQWMTRRGLPVHRYGNNIVSGDVADSRKTILLNAHIDTVAPAAGYTRNPYSPAIMDGKLYGLGSNDDGASLVALLAAYERLRLSPQPYRIIFSATAEEERSGKGGIEMILPHLGEVALGVFGEPTRMQMAVAEKGLMVLDCTAYGVSGHAARDEGVNALYAALEDIAWLRSYRFPRVSPFLGEVKMTVTQINAGTQHNVVPDRCRFVVDIRPNGLYSNEEILAIIRENLTSEVTPRSTRLNSSHIDMNHPIVVRGKALGLTAFGSPTLSNQALVAFPSLKIGPGDSARSHSADEFIYLHEIEYGINTYIQLLDNLNV